LKTPIIAAMQSHPAALHTDETFYSIEDFSRVAKYDAHVHLNVFDEDFIKNAEEDNYRLVTINVDVFPGFPTIDEQQQVAIECRSAFPGLVNFASTFYVKNFNTNEWQQQTIDRIKNSQSEGAIGVKVWKNIGMELKDEAGNFVMIDNANFDPVFDFLAKNNIPLLGHLGEPRNCWLPLEKMTVQGDVNYFSAHPEYHMYLHPEYPSYEEQIDARDRMLEKHPDLKFVGLHLASLEWNVDEVAKRLDRFSNLAVDLAERISHLQLQAIDDWQKVRDFCIKYQDRIIYGTDIIVDGTKDPLEMKKHAHDIRLRHWKFFTSDEMMRVPKVDGEFKALRLPASVVDKIYRHNAEKWYPALLKNHTAVATASSIA
jgi:predicted TIM-barrel fold metal-dependent hydrolase